MLEYHNFRLENRFREFASKYASLYSKDAWEFIENNFYNNIHKRCAPDILMQVYAELGLYQSPAKFYHRHLKIIKDNFPIDGNIIDIGSGMIPSFANLMASEQRRLGKGTITIYEPLLLEMTPKYSNMELHKEDFTTNTDISKYDLVTGIMPCGATESILESAIKNRKNFYVAMCGCVHSPLSYFYGYLGTSPELYQEKVIEDAKELMKTYDNGTLIITRLKNTEINYPILYNKK